MDENVQIEIERYLRDELNREEKQLFIKKIEADPLLKEEVDLQQSLFNVLGNKGNGVENLNNNTDEVKKIRTLLKSEEYKKIAANINENTISYLKAEKKQSRKKVMFRSALAMAAVLVLFFALTPLLKNDNAQLYNDYAQWDNIPSFVEKGTTEMTLVDVEKKYKLQEYREVIEITNAIPENIKVSNPNLFIYLGASYFQNNEYEKALETFSVFANSSAYDSSKGHWYMTLVYLKQDRLEDAKNELKIITSSANNYNYDKALELSKKLE